MDELVRRACQIVGADPKRVIKSRTEGDVVVVIVDNGPKGCPKYVVPLDKLGAPEPVASDIVATTDALAYAKEHGIDMLTVRGTGRGGKILLRDVKAVADD